jgi:hypothetical protein
MANICENKIAVYGSKENIAVFNEYIQAKEKESEKDCYSTFFSDFIESELRVETLVLNCLEDKCYIYIDTAWMPPTLAVYGMSHMFPNLIFNLTYSESGAGFSGFIRIKNCECLGADETTKSSKRYSVK